ncbi:MAG: hypothetical protein JO332_02490 [Planctomycetaceae bacterium]|nr:hypothetical protein [Planctomycetaceae bacterium]
MTSRRRFLADVGRGALTAALGFRVAGDLGFVPAFAGQEPETLTFGPLEPLVTLLQDTRTDRLLRAAMEQLRNGVALKRLVAAAALANARSFGGEDYVGFHTMMALSPALHMAAELPEQLQPLPVFKVLYRNSARLQETGTRNTLRPVAALPLPEGKAGGIALRDAVRRREKAEAEGLFATIARGGAAEAFNHLLTEVQDSADVHRVNLPWRAWELLDVVGPEHAHTLLRQSLHYCLQNEPRSPGTWSSAARNVLPKVFDAHHLEDRTPGTREADDAWVEQLSRTIFESTAEQAAEAAAAALAEGFAPAAIAEAISLAANQLVLRDVGRRPQEEQPGKPIGSVHGDSIGVHASDSANAWRGMALAGNARNTFACLILGAWQAAYDRVSRGGDFLKWAPLPIPATLDRVTAKDPAALVQELDAAVRDNLQARACAVVQRAGELGHEARPLFDVLLRYAISEDGALHAEKYYRTCAEEFAAARPAFRWRHLVSLARVTASEYGRPAAGMAEARRLLSC